MGIGYRGLGFRAWGLSFWRVDVLGTSYIFPLYRVEG